VDTTGRQTVLHSFTGGADGGYPYAGVIGDSAGNLYGTTCQGGTTNVAAPHGNGVVYKLDTTGPETVLYNFTGGADGGCPVAGVIRDSAGNLYGTAQSGGTAGTGVVYKLDSTGHETVLFSFTGTWGGGDGDGPIAGVIRDPAGNLYGTTFNGGAANAGVVYRLDTTGHATVLYSFTGGADGDKPVAGVIRDSAGNLYGTASYGGTANAGVVYKLDTTGHETLLYTFTGGADGDCPMAGVIRDSAGNLYGTTQGGGTGGVVYKLDSTGHETVLYSFTGGADGDAPWAGVIGDSAGNLYGTTYGGGATGRGTVYKVDSTGHETVLYSFPVGTDGGDPYAGVIGDSAGNLYGTTTSGGTANAGVVYKVDGAGHETVLYTFTGGADGGGPYAGVIRDSNGNLYGTTYHGGTAGAGVVYKLDTVGQETVLYSFTGGADGGVPNGVIRDPAGNLYGTTSGGGTANAGVVYKLDTTGQETVLYSFTGGPDGGQPQAGVIFGGTNLYGTTTRGGTGACYSGCGVVYKVDATGQETVLYNFAGGADGVYPLAGVIRDSAGNLYGATFYGGAVNAGVVYKVDGGGHETVLYTFTGLADGGNPSGVIRDSAGNLYGTTSNGGAMGGVVFKLDTTGQETVLYSFTGGADGGNPSSGVIRDAAGNLYGTTSNGGKGFTGVVFKLTP